MLSDPKPVVICYYFHYFPGNWVWLHFLCAVQIWGDLPCKSDIFAKKLQIILIHLKFVLWSLNGLIFVLRTSGKSYWSVWLAWITMAEVQKPIEIWNQKIKYKTCITIHLYLGVSSSFYKSWGNMSRHYESAENIENKAIKTILMFTHIL